MMRGIFKNKFMHTPACILQRMWSIPAIEWKSMYMFSADHKNGYFHISLHPSACKFFGCEWEGQSYVWGVLSFGWKPCAFIYETTTRAVADYVSTETGSQMKTYIDDSWGTIQLTPRNSPGKVNLIWPRRLQYTYSFNCITLFHAGYFLSLSESVLIPTRRIRHFRI